MTYEELQNRLNKVETAITALQTGSYQNLDFNIEETLGQLEQQKATLQEQLTTLAESQERHQLSGLEDKIDKAVEKQKASPDTAALALIGSIQKNIALNKGITFKNWTDGLQASAPEVVNRLKKALEGKFAYYGKHLDVDYKELERVLARSEYTGTSALPDDTATLKTFIVKKEIEEGESTDSHVITNRPESKKEVEKLAREKGVSSSAFRKKVQNAKPGDTFNLEEDHHHNPNDDSDMAKIQLLQVAEYAHELLEMIENGQELDAWIQAKLTKVADYIGTVKHYLEGEAYLDHEYGKDHPAKGDENFYNAIPEEYKAMYESWVSRLTGRQNKFVGKLINFKGHEYKVLDIDDAGTVTLIDPNDATSKAFYVNRAQLKQGLIEPEEEAEEIELNIEPEDE